MVKVVCVAISCAFLISCSGIVNRSMYESKETDSFACNVAKAAGIVGGNSRDPYLSKDGVQVADLALATTLGYRGFTTMTPVFGSNALAGPLGILSALSTSQVDDFSQAVPQMVAWMPQSLASTPEEAQEKFKHMLASAMRQAAQDVVPDKLVGSENAQSPDTLIPLSDPACEGGAFCGYGLNVKLSGGQAIDHSFPIPKSGIAPDFAGGQPAWVWSPKSGAELIIAGANTQYKRATLTGAYNYYSKPTFPDLEFWGRVTELLPEWVFVYVTPRAKTGENFVHVGPGKSLPGHLLLNKGKAHFFIKPS